MAGQASATDKMEDVSDDSRDYHCLLVVQKTKDEMGTYNILLLTLIDRDNSCDLGLSPALNVHQREQ